MSTHSKQDAAGNISKLLKDLESPLDDVRLSALKGLRAIPSLAMLRAVRRVAAFDPSVTVRFEAQEMLQLAARRLAPEGTATDTDGKPSLERLQELLAHPEAEVRVRVIQSLALSVEPTVPKILARALLREKDGFVVCALLPALAATGASGAAQLIAPYLDNPDARVRAVAVEALEVTNDPKVLSLLLPRLKDDSPRVRALAARATQAHDRETVLACIDEMLGSDREDAATAALNVLRFFDEETAVGRLASKLGAPWPTARQAALGSLLVLARQGSVRAGQVLARTREKPAAPSAAGLADGALSPVAASLEDRLQSGALDTRLSAVREAVRLGREDLLGRLRSMLAFESHPRLAATVLAALGKLGSAADDLPTLTRYLGASDPRLRANAVEAIGLLSRSRGGELLAPSLEDPHNRVRANAIVALHGATGVDVMPALDGMAASDAPPMVVSAIWAAATIATPATVAVLARLLQSADKDVARRAREALAALEGVLPQAAQALQAAPARDTAPKAAPPSAPRLPESRMARLLFDLRHESPEVRLNTVRSIAALKDASLLQQVRPMLADEDSAVCQAAREAVRALLLACGAPVPDPEALARFRAELSAGDARARKALSGVVDVALHCGIPQTAEVLTARLPLEESPTARAQILSSLALLGDASAARLAQAFVRDPDPRVRATAIDAIHLAGSQEDRRATVGGLADPDPRVRAAAIRASLVIYREPFLSQLRSMLWASSPADRAAGLHVVRTTPIAERYELLRDHFMAETHPRLFATCADALAMELVASHADEREAVLGAILDPDKRQCLASSLEALDSLDHRSGAWRPAPAPPPAPPHRPDFAATHGGAHSSADQPGVDPAAEPPTHPADLTSAGAGAQEEPTASGESDAASAAGPPDATDSPAATAAASPAARTRSDPAATGNAHAYASPDTAEDFQAAGPSDSTGPTGGAGLPGNPEPPAVHGIPDQSPALDAHSVAGTAAPVHQASSESDRIAGSTSSWDIVSTVPSASAADTPADASARPRSAGRRPDAAPARRRGNVADEPSAFTQLMDLERDGLMTPDRVRTALEEQRDPIAVASLLEKVGQMMLPDAVLLVRPFANWRDRRVRLAVAAALKGADDVEALEMLRSLVRDRDPEVSKRALAILSERGPVRAHEAIESLMAMEPAWAIRRGLDLLEATGDAARLPLVLKTLERGIDPALVEPIHRLITAWGTQDTLAAISQTYIRGAARHRPFLLEVGTALASKLHVPSTELAKLFPVDLAATGLAGLERRGHARLGTGPASSAPPPPEPFSLPPFLTHPVFLGSVGLAVLAGLLMSLWPSSIEPKAGATIVQSRVLPGPQIIVGSGGGSSSGALVFASVTEPRQSDLEPAQTLQEVESNLKLSMASQGIKSVALVHMVALDRFQGGYRLDMIRAKELFDHGNIDEALRILDNALAQMDPENLMGRMALLRALEVVCLKGQRHSRLAEIRAQMKDTEDKLLEMMLKAARESGVSEEQIKKTLAALEKRKKSAEGASRATDYMSGVALASPPPEGASGEPGTDTPPSPDN